MTPSRRRPGRRPPWGDVSFATITGIAAGLVVTILVAVVAVLYLAAQSSIATLGLRFLVGREWDPRVNVYGIVPGLVGTLLTSGIALLAAVPLSIGAAIFLTQHAPEWLRGPVSQLIELLAAIPSILYGYWGLIFLVPVMRRVIEPGIKSYLGWTGLFSGTPVGLDIFTASVVLTIMIIPTIAAIARDTVAVVPVSQKEAALSLGATDWEVTRTAVLPYARSGIFAGIVLGLGRALGETMAVTMLIGNSYHVPTSLFSQGQTISSHILNQYLEASSPLELSALVESGLILLTIALVINVVARAVLYRVQGDRGAAQE